MMNNNFKGHKLIEDHSNGFKIRNFTPILFFEDRTYPRKFPFIWINLLSKNEIEYETKDRKIHIRSLLTEMLEDD